MWECKDSDVLNGNGSLSNLQQRQRGESCVSNYHEAKLVIERYYGRGWMFQCVLVTVREEWDESAVGREGLDIKGCIREVCEAGKERKKRKEKGGRDAGHKYTAWVGAEKRNHCAITELSDCACSISECCAALHFASSQFLI